MSNVRILIVENEKAIAEGLRLDGYAVDTCGDGNEAYELLLIWLFLTLICGDGRLRGSG